MSKCTNPKCHNPNCTCGENCTCDEKHQCSEGKKEQGAKKEGCCCNKKNKQALQKAPQMLKFNRNVKWKNRLSFLKNYRFNPEAFMRIQIDKSLKKEFYRKRCPI